MTKLRESLDTIMEENLKEEGSLIIIGDWNARIGEENARIEIKKEEDWKRKSEDKTLNNEGKKMLDFCEEYGITIMNGRMRGDEEGKYTHIGENGASVIGYIMIKEYQGGATNKQDGSWIERGIGSFADRNGDKKGRGKREVRRDKREGRTGMEMEGREKGRISKNYHGKMGRQKRKGDRKHRGKTRRFYENDKRGS